MRLAQADASIDAPIDIVWAIMLDLSGYSQWNPFIVRVDRPADREPQVGDAITLHVRFRGGTAVASRERITTVDPPATLDGVTRATLCYEFYGHLHKSGMIRGRRYQTLDQKPGEPTLYHTEERFRGPLAFVLSIPTIQDGFTRHAHALKNHAESQ